MWTPGPKASRRAPKAGSVCHGASSPAVASGAVLSSSATRSRPRQRRWPSVVIGPGHPDRHRDRPDACHDYENGGGDGFGEAAQNPDDGERQEDERAGDAQCHVGGGDEAGDECSDGPEPGQGRAGRHAWRGRRWRRAWGRGWSGPWGRSSGRWRAGWWSLRRWLRTGWRRRWPGWRDDDDPADVSG